MNYTKQDKIAVRDISAGELITGADWLNSADIALLKLLAKHTRSKELAYKSGLSYEAIRMRIKRVLKKTGTHDHAELLIWAIRHGVVTVEKESSNGSNRLQAASGQRATDPARSGVRRKG